jgi:hypothetical protein
MNLPHVTANLRNILVGVATALLASTSSLAEPGVTNDAITLGQSTALSGPLGRPRAGGAQGIEGLL